jgi:undecaprenyl diphosphate synthase
MDGNGRWATARGLSRAAGHRRGAEAVRRVVEAAPELGVRVLTLYAFSSDNWQRPAGEVNALMFLFEKFLARESDRLVEAGVRLNIVGRRDRLRGSIVRAIERVEAATAGGSTLLLRVAIDYSARQAIAVASSLPALPGCEPIDDFARRLETAIHSVADVPAVDLVVRTSGEQRLSDFLLWESAYAELAFLPVLWPDFGGADLAAALESFRQRERRFGRVSAVAS